MFGSVNWVIIGSNNSLLPVWCQAIIGTNAGLLLIGPSGANFSEIRIKIQFPYPPGPHPHKKILSLNMLTHWHLMTPCGDKDLGQHWHRQWLVAWTNVDLSMGFCGMHLGASSQVALKNSICNMDLESSTFRIIATSPRVNELISSCLKSEIKRDTYWWI